MADPEHLETLLLNLISNAILHGHCKKLNLSLWEQPENYVLAVDDDGAGIASDALGLVFERYRSPAPVREITGGVGLGLTAARRIAQISGAPRFCRYLLALHGNLGNEPLID